MSRRKTGSATPDYSAAKIAPAETFLKLTFSSRRSVIKRRRREFSSCSSLIWLICSCSIGISVRSPSSISSGVERIDVPWAFRQRWYVITLIPKDLAIALCSLPWAVISPAMRSFSAISNSVCLCLVATSFPLMVISL